MKRKAATKKKRPVAAVRSGSLLADVRELIVQTREGVARAVDAGLVTLYWHVGRRIRTDLLKEKRAEYGKRIVYSLSTQLVDEFGPGYSARNLWHMVRFAEAFPNPKIVSALSTQLGWTHFRQIIALDDPLKRDFYAEMCRMEKWNTRPEWNEIKDTKSSAIERKRTEDFLPGGFRKRTIEYEGPFDHCDREQDYATVWKEFERRSKLRIEKGQGYGIERKR